MKERPILFSGPMVRAIIAGTKTQTRRQIKVRGKYAAEDGEPTVVRGEVWKPARVDYSGIVECPYGQPGDRLWVRETWRTYRSLDAIKPVEIAQGAGIEYAAGGSSVYDYNTLHGMGKWRPSIFMPRWASRITLEITAVRVERLQEISDSDVISEGTEHAVSVGTVIPGKLAYQWLWESINGKGSWDKNPWVWVITFKKL